MPSSTIRSRCSVVASTRVRVRPVEPTGKLGFFGPVGTRGKDHDPLLPWDLLSYRPETPDNTKLQLIPDHRGVITEVICGHRFGRTVRAPLVVTA